MRKPLTFFGTLLVILVLSTVAFAQETQAVRPTQLHETGGANPSATYVMLALGFGLMLIIAGVGLRFALRPVEIE